MRCVSSVACCAVFLAFVACGDGGEMSEEAQDTVDASIPDGSGDATHDADEVDTDGSVARDAGDAAAARFDGGVLDDPLDVDSPKPAFLQRMEGDWRVLLTGDWELEEGTEGYYCARFTLPEDVYFNAFRPVSPPGTHHTVLSFDSEPQAEDGVKPCTAVTNGETMIAGSGVGTEPLVLPEGVAVLAPKGSQLLLNLHLFNASPDPMRGRSGTLVKTVPVDEVEEIAASILAGTIDIRIPTGRVTESGTCTFGRDVTLVALGPHMHQLGVYMKAVAHSSVMGDVVLYDGDYDFREQRIYPLDSIPMKAGDTVDVECTYENDTDSTVTYGDSSLQEMCFAGLIHYPVDERPGLACLN